MADYVSQFTGAEIDSRLRKAGTAVQPADLESKQDTLVSGENIKTVNGQSIVGSGNIQIQAGDTDAVKYVEQTLTDAQKTQARTNIGAAAASALSALETAIAAKYSKPSGGIPETDLASAVQSALALARTSIQSLADYYSKTEVDALLEAVGSEQYVDVTALPTASASTLGKIYLVGPDANGFYDRYYTSYDGSTYSWVAAGNTEINLANYATKEELSQLRQEVIELSTPSSVKRTLYTLLRNVAFANDNGYETELAKIYAWAENLVLMSISATFTQGTASIYETDSLDKLKQYLVVTATFDDSSTTVLNDSDYSLSGTLTVGTCTISVNYQGKTDTFTVVVSASPYLYILPSTFTSTGSNSIDTGFMPEKQKVYTILCECTESTASSKAVFIYGNRKTASSSGYIGFTTQSGSVWGMGLSYGNRKSIGSNLFRSVAIMTISDSGFASVSLNYKIGSNSIATSSTSYNTDITTTANVKNFCLGDVVGNSTGFNGTISYFAIYDGEMASTDRNYFLNNGA